MNWIKKWRQGRELSKQEKRELKGVSDRYAGMYNSGISDSFCGTPELNEKFSIKMKYDALRRENGIPPKWTKRKNI